MSRTTRHLGPLFAALLLSACGAFVDVALPNLHGIHTDRLPSSAMEPTLKKGDVIVWKEVNKEEAAELLPGEVVVFRAPGKPPGSRYIKRIIAMEGEVVEIRKNTLFVDGEEIDEPYAKVGSKRSTDDGFGPVEVPAGHRFVMGDNWDDSMDSRAFGPIPLSEILGRVSMPDE